MKKVISIVLALLMMIPMAAMLVPTASAATTVDHAPGSTSGKVYYEENFDDPALKDLVDKDLAAALGWNEPSSTATLWIEDGKVRVFTQYTPSGVYPATENKWAGGYSTGVLVTDPQLVRNTTVLEYKFQYNRHAAGEENNVKVTTKDGNSKTVKADGQGTYQCVEFYYTTTQAGAAKNAGSDNSFVRINQGGDGWANTMKGVDGASADKNAVYWKTTTFQKVNSIAAGDTVKLEMQNNPVVTTESDAALTSTIMNREYSVKVVVEPWAHRLYAFVDGQLFITKSTDVNGANYGLNDWGRLISESVGLLFKPGVDATVDDIKLYDYVPNLTISEVMVNGAKANGTGKYQWIEITNPSDAAVNVYDYAIHLETMANVYNKDTSYLIGCETDQGTGAWYVDAASTLGYFTPGAKTLGSEVFDSPSYENGVLQPGESAIVLFPQTAMAGGTSVTDEAFNAYLENLGMPAGTKTFVVDNESNYNFSIGTLTNESATIQIVKATNTATDGYAPVADCKGQPAEFSPAFAECTTWVTSKGSGSGTAFWGLTVKNYQNVPQEALGSTTNFGNNSDKSYEIKYNGWVNSYAVQVVDFDHTNLKWGFSLYQPDDVRKNAKGEDVYATPGFVPAELRRVQIATVKGVDGTVTEKLVNPNYANAVEIDTPQSLGYDVQVWVNGEMKVANAKTEKTTLNLTAAEVTNANALTIEVKYYREGSMFVGYQKSEVVDGKYTLRLLAVANNPDAYDALGFDIYMAWGEGEKSKIYDVGYVYESVTVTEGGETTTVTPKDLGYNFEYFYAVHINNIPEELTDLEVYAKAIYTIDGEVLEAPGGDNQFTVAE
ncbi:MAG: hypothetical protein IKA76_04015 [Clostridia bacterium]|nr:hypothetical protein [Clostridia bacterium]